MCYGFSSLKVICHLKCSRHFTSIWNLKNTHFGENNIFNRISDFASYVNLCKQAEDCKLFNTKACVVTDHHLIVVARTDWKNQRYGKGLKAHVWVTHKQFFFYKELFSSSASKSNNMNLFSVYSQLSDRNSLVDLIQTFWWQDWLTIGFVESTCNFC